MSLGTGNVRKFLSETQIEADRQLGIEPVDSSQVKPLYEQLQEHKRKAQEELEASGKMSNFVKQIDEDEYEFLEEIRDQQKNMEETRKRLEAEQIREFRQRVVSLEDDIEHDYSETSTSRPVKSKLKDELNLKHVKLRRLGLKINNSSDKSMGSVKDNPHNTQTLSNNHENAAVNINNQPEKSATSVNVTKKKENQVNFKATAMGTGLVAYESSEENSESEK